MHFYLMLRKDSWAGLVKETVFAFELLFCLKFKLCCNNIVFLKAFLVWFSLTMLAILWNHRWSYFIGLWVKFWRGYWHILTVHSQKLDNRSFFLWFWCRTTPILVIQFLLLSVVLWQEHLHQLFPSLAALPPHCHTAQILFHLQSWAFTTQHAVPLKNSHFNLSWQLLSVAWREIF